jgi:hypothetical protein
VQVDQRADDALQRRALLTKLLCPDGIVPDLGIFEFARDFGQAL